MDKYTAPSDLQAQPGVVMQREVSQKYLDRLKCICGWTVQVYHMKNGKTMLAILILVSRPSFYF